MKKNRDGDSCILPLKESKRVVKITTLLVCSIVCCISTSIYAKDSNVSIKATSSSSLAGVQQTQKEITGTIVDETGIPIAGANVIEKGTANGTITDAQGRFSLNVAPGATLREVLP